ncbi:hypothetical protein VKT23_020602 [Stygiomarasmius scandens]|uniref:Uncharacterized protein n=1 Tax=Marasmiellus scandens TaxID=2682957 RepID=A0ABR1IIY1_9AGAR
MTHQSTARATRSRTKDSDLCPPLDVEPPRRRRPKKITHNSEPQNAIESEQPPPDPGPGSEEATEGQEGSATSVETPHETSIITRSPTPHPSIVLSPDAETDTLPNELATLGMLDVSMADLDAEAEEIALKKSALGVSSSAELEPEQQAFSGEPSFTRDPAPDDSSDPERQAVHNSPTPPQHYQSRLLRALEKQGIVLTSPSSKRRSHASQTHIPQPLSPMRSRTSLNDTVGQEIELFHPRPPFTPAVDDTEERDDESEWGGCVSDDTGPTESQQQSVGASAPPPPLSPSRAQEAVAALREYSASASMSIPAITSKLESILQTHFTKKWSDAVDTATPQDPDDKQCQGRLELLVPSLLRPQRAKKSVSYAPTSTDANDSLVDYDSGGSSDYGAEQEEEQRKKMAKLRRTKKIKAKERQDAGEYSASGEEDDDDDPEQEDDYDDSEEDPALVPRHTRRGKERRKKNKKATPKVQGNGTGKAPASTPTTIITTNNKGKKAQNGSPDATIGDEDEDKDEDEDSSTGKIPAAMQAEVWHLRTQYESEMQRIASRFGQPVHHAYKLAGEVTVRSRDPNLFNIFEKWWVAEGGNNGKLPNDVNPGTFFGEQWQNHRKETLGEAWNDSQKVEEEYAWLRTWFSDRYSNDPKMTRGPTKADVKKVAGVVSDVAKQAMLNRGVLVFSFVIDPVGEHSMIAGWGKEFKALKTEHPTQITRQLQDVTTLVRHERINAEVGAAVSDELQNLALKASEVGTDRERERALVPQILLYDIGTLGIKAKKFKWKSFANYAYRNQICIKNWPEGIPAPGSGLTKVNHAVPKAGGPSQLTLARIQELMLLREGWARKEENPSIPDHIRKAALRVVSWSDEDKALPPNQQKDVALVSCVDGRTLTSVLHSTDWQTEQGQDDAEVGVSTNTKTNPRSKQKPKLKSKTPVVSEQHPASPTLSSPASPARLEVEPPQYWENYCFSEAEDDNLRREPDPSPLSSPVRPERGAPNLFLAARAQSRYLASSEPDDIEPSTQPAYGGYRSSRSTSIPRPPIDSQPRKVSNNPLREPDRNPIAGPSRLSQEGVLVVRPRPVTGNPEPKRPRNNQETSMRPQKRPKKHHTEGRLMTTKEKWREMRRDARDKQPRLTSKGG